MFGLNPSQNPPKPTWDVSIGLNNVDVGKPIDLENGMSMTAPYGLDAAEGADLLIAPAYDNEERPSEAVLDLFRRAHARGAWLLSVCTGAFLFGEARHVELEPDVGLDLRGQGPQQGVGELGLQAGVRGGGELLLVSHGNEGTQGLDCAVMPAPTRVIIIV